jgi:SAM-dependent methyltransferase
MSAYEYVGGELELFANAGNWKRYFADLLQPFVRGRVLEVGAGIGETARVLSNASVASWVCVEPDPALADRIAAVRLATGERPAIIVGDITATPAAPAFDTILYIDVLEHIEDDGGELARAAERLAPGGHLVILAPAFQFLFSAFDRAIGHHRRYTKRTLARAAPRGVVPVMVRYVDSAGMLLSLANRMLLRQSLPKLRQILFWDRRVIPLSRRIDPWLRHRFGRSIIGVYRR